MHLRQLTIPLLTLLPLLAAAGGKQTPERHAAATAAVAGTAGEEPAAADTVIVVDKVQVTAIKQGMVLRSQPVAATIVGSRAIERERIGALKHLSQQVPNFYAPDYGSRMTSSIYVRGLGARIDQPVMGLNIDNVPVLNKDNYDTELADAERIEVLRGPQSTLYGRNTMGGVINVYTLSPLSYEGVRLSAEYGSGDSYKFRASSYYKLTPDLGMAVTGYYTHTGGFFENLATGDKCDWERLGGGRWKTQWRSRTGLRIDNTLSFSVLEQGGYPYAYVGDDIIGDDGRPVVRRGEIRYNDPCSYRRTALSVGLTIRYDAGSFTVASITSYQYSDDEMILDQDFLPLSYFTLRQARTEHSVTEDLVFRSRGDKAYRWLLGAFGFYRHGTMNAPVHFKQTGIEELILKYANENDQSYRYFMNTNLFDHVNIDKTRTFVPNGLEPDSQKACNDYNQIIQEKGPIDLQLLGLGHNGHIGFNEPGEAFEKETHCVDLTESTIEANKRFFESEDDVPKQAYTMGIKNIMQAKKILVVVSGADKADILKEVLYGPITPEVPASILQLHNDVTIVADEAALSKIDK